MANTTDFASGRRKAASTSPRAAATDTAPESVQEAIGEARERQLEEQVAQLQSDLKAIAATLAKIGGDKVAEGKEIAATQVAQLRRQGQDVVGEVQEQAIVYEKQLKDTIREKPLTAVASAMGIGFILALLTRG